MDYIGIVFLVILLIYFINGLRKGFLVNLFESVKTIVVLVLAFIFCKDVGQAFTGLGFLEKFSKEMITYASTIIGFIVIMLAGTILFGIVLFIVKKLTSEQGIGSRLLGGAVGVVRALITIGLYCYIIGFIYNLTPDSGIGNFINNSLNHEVGIFRFFYEHNLIEYIFDKFISNPVA